MRIGVDLGGTKTEVIALGADGECLHRERRPTPANDYDGIVLGIAALVEAAEAAVGRRGSVGIGVPGSPSPHSGLMRNANTTSLIGKPFQADLERALQREVRLENDANCFVLSEATDGAGRGARLVFGVILGTGTGGGFTLDGQLWTGHNAVAGEWGHNPLPWPDATELPGPACYCGKHGCIETFLSGPGLARDHTQHGGTGATAEAIAAAARAGDAVSQASLDRYADRLARALASVINILDPDVIVLGGGMSNIQCLYSAVPKRWAAHVFSDEVRTHLRAAVHGDSSGVRGAAWLWP